MKHNLVIRVLVLLVPTLFFAPNLKAQWEPDRRLSTTDTAASLNENMGQCLAASGDSVHVVWWDRKNSGSRIYYKHSFDGGVTWGPDAVIPGTPNHADFPSIAVSGATVHVAFRDSSTGQYITYYKRSLDGGMTWGPNISLGVYYWWPSITATGSMVFVALNDLHPGNTEVYCRRSTDNGNTWDTVHQISNAPNRSEDPSIAAGGGCVHLAWNDNRTGLMQTWYRRSSDQGVTWGPETQLSNTTVFCYFPIVHVSGANVDLAYGDEGSGQFEIFFKQSTDFGATWGTSRQLTHSGGKAVYPVIARDSSNIHIVHSSFGGDAYYLHSSDGGATWDSSKSLVSVANKPTNTFIVAVGHTLHVIWLDARNGYPAVYYKRSSIIRAAIFNAPNTVAFGDVKINSARDTTIVLRNFGTAQVKILKYSIVGSTGFILADSSMHTIAAHDSGTIKVHFDPVSAQSYVASVMIMTDEATLGSHQIQLTGRGIGPKLDLSVATLDFGKVDSGASLRKTFTITNNGTAAATISSFQLTGSKMFAVDTPTTPFAISVSAQRVISIAFKPVTSGPLSATLTIGSAEGVQSQLLLAGIGLGKKDTASRGVRFPTTSSVISLLEVSPNPASQRATLKLNLAKHLEDVNVSFYDAAGRLVLTQHIGALNEGMQRIPMALPRMSGVSLLRVSSGGQLIGTAELIITR